MLDFCNQKIDLQGKKIFAKMCKKTKIIFSELKKSQIKLVLCN